MWMRDARLARTLSLVTLGWLVAESGLGLAAGFEAHSVALIGWGVSALVEGMAGLIVVWRFTGSRLRSPAAERVARRLVAVSFWVLAPYLIGHVAYDVSLGYRPEPTALGIAVTTISLVSMPLLGVAKRRLGARLGSPATRGEGTQNLLCAAMAGAVLAGLAFNALGWWWVDALAALALAATAVHEGRRAWRGEACCH
ncbi:cation transporter [Thermopolyspora sp. NPDC052614]|uniref:cation transporter n=1 Tax=Thermopolyspora sp. NPDC052614 TaxID=3155682 RepID=UPI003446132E